MFSPSAIADFLACRHLASLERDSAAGVVMRPWFADPQVELLIKLGQQHEQKYLEELRKRGLSVIAVAPGGDREKAATSTVEAIRSGADVIYQPAFLAIERGRIAKGAGEDARGPSEGDTSWAAGAEDGWFGRADFLIKVERHSELGSFSYEVVETKLARSTKARAIVQLCFYSDLLAQVQGVVPDYMHVVLGGAAKPETFFVQRYLAFFRKIKKDFIEAQQDLELVRETSEGKIAAVLDNKRQGGHGDPISKSYPEPVEHCRICDWTMVCDDQWRNDDHLSLVANITRNQRHALSGGGTRTLVALVNLSGPPEGINEQAFRNLHQQARLQLEGREEKQNVYELLEPIEVDKGLCSLPVPSPGDVFLDFEGSQFAHEGGLEYLFGVLTIDDSFRRDTPNGKDGDLETKYEPLWAMNPVEEKRAFEKFIGMVMDRRQQYPDRHVYHYGAYEETAIKRMAGRHSTCVDEVDELLRGEVLVDMFRAVKQGLRASVESYSIKKLEPFYQFKRAVNLPDANKALQTFESMLVFGMADDSDALKTVVEGYNRDDCVSALRLRTWLESLRSELETKNGSELSRPVMKHTEVEEDLAEYLQRVRATESRLLEALPEDRESWDDAEEARWLLAQLLEWHRREDKSSWWNYFRLCDLSEQELIEDKAALGGLEFVGEVEKVKKSIVYRYRFPLQDHAIDRAPTVHDPKTQKGAGDVVAIDQRNLTIDIKRGLASKVGHPRALIPYEIVGSKAMRESLLQLGNWVAENGIDAKGRFRASRDLLLRKTVGNFELLKANVDGTVLPIQGPPGSGKTYTGARMIVDLVRNGKKVGVTAVSHKVISKLLSEVCDAARQDRTIVRVVQKFDDDGCIDEMVEQAKDNESVAAALERGDAQIAAGTVWLWSRDELTDSIDYLFVDEAGQMSLANVLAAAQATENIVLLGDPQQLDQPQRGVHPPGADASALSHLLNGRATIEEGKGLFLAESWRLPPDICRFTSEVFYDGRFKARAENANQSLNASGVLTGTGFRYLPVEHTGNQSESVEEVKRIAGLVDELLSTGTTWTNKRGQVGILTLQDLLIVAPYNRQVSALLRQLPKGARVGTVDKFQGQEAPVVIYSMATSTPEDAPRGMEFLYSSNRLNVATSRAQCVTVLVASPDLFDVSCKTPRQMELANAFCHYLEIASS